MKKYSTTTIELEYSYSYSSTFVCTRTHTHEKVLDYNYRAGVLTLVKTTGLQLKCWNTHTRTCTHTQVNQFIKQNAFYGETGSRNCLEKVSAGPWPLKKTFFNLHFKCQQNNNLSVFNVQIIRLYNLGSWNYLCTWQFQNLSKYWGLGKVSTTTLTHNNDNEWYIYLRNKDTMSQSLPQPGGMTDIQYVPKKVSLYLFLKIYQNQNVGCCAVMRERIYIKLTCV